MIKIIRNFWIFKQYPITKEFTKFCLVGFSNLIIDTGVYWILTRLADLHFMVAAVLAFAVAVTWSFYINRKWTFRHNGADLRSQYIKFFIVNIIGISINLSLFYYFVEILSWHDILSKLIVAVIVSFFNFGLSKFWAFSSVRKELKIKNNEVQPDLDM